MSDFDETTFDPDMDPAEERLGQDAPRKRSLLKRIALTLLTIVGVLVVAGVMLYEFGSMERPSPQMRTQYEALVASGQAPRLPRPGFHLPIPGCKCHSTDPALTMQHEGYRIRDCGSCHGGAAQAQAQATSPAY
jgi:hypothetical protein